MTAGIRDAAQATEAVKGVDIARKKRLSSLVIGALVAVNVAMVAWWAAGRAGVPPQVDEAFDAVDAISRGVEKRRDTSGLVPPTLDGVLSDVPAEAARLIRDGRLRYRPSRDRRTFTVETVFDRTTPAGTAEEDES